MFLRIHYETLPIVIGFEIVIFDTKHSAICIYKIKPKPPPLQHVYKPYKLYMKSSPSNGNTGVFADFKI